MADPFASLRNRHGERLDAALHPVAGARALAVVAHGITSDKDRPYLVELAGTLAASGVAALRFSFSGHGASGGRFEDVTPSKELDDLGCVLDAAAAAGFARVTCVGHSLGAAVGLLRAARDPRVGALVSLAGMLHVGRFMQRHFGGLAFGQPLLGRPGCPWSRTLAEDSERTGSLLPQAAAVRVPWLLVHGTADELVPVEESREARAAAGGRPELVELAGVDHRFTGASGAVAAVVARWVAGHVPA
jgi:pimeloyl-ACP methyl ester carboxylesterase